MAPALPPALTAVLDKVDEALHKPLNALFAAAAMAIERLSDVDLLKYEASTADRSPDLALLEQMAPVIGGMAADVNGLLKVLRAAFPESSRGTDPRALRTRVAKRVEASTQELTQLLSQLGERMRDPEVAADRWRLLAELQSMRSRMRDAAGNLVFQTAVLFDDVNARDVVPGYQAEEESAKALRTTVADLARTLASRIDKITWAVADDMRFYIDQSLKDLDAFGRSPAFRALRAQDKQKVIEFRDDFRRMAARANPVKDHILESLRPLWAFIAALSRVNEREILVAHDRETCAACGVLLERADSMITTQTAMAAAVLGEAKLRAHELYGRDERLDAFLRGTRTAKPTNAEPDALLKELQTLRALLGNLTLR